MPIQLGQQVSNAEVTAVAVNASVVTILVIAVRRVSFIIHNDCNNRTLYIKYGSGASLTDFSVRIAPDTTFEPQANYTGLITGIWNAAGTGNALITEITNI